MTTGYGEAIVKAGVHADGGEVETFAHLRAAQEFCSEVTFVLDIGGQDMKCFFVKDGSIGNITLNEACSAGCGSFIQNFAEGLHMTPAEFAKLAIGSKAPVDLGTRCTVFMNSKVKQAQKEGAEVADISAGIAFSVIKNALFKVMQLKDVRTLGDHIVVQGGTFYNDAVLRCMEKLLDRNVIRPDIAGIMGAYGAAILALEAGYEKSSLLSAEELSHFDVKTSSYRCGGCGNKCLITMQRFPDGGKYFTGNRCERGIGGEKPDESETPNIYRYKYDRLFRYYRPLEHPTRGTITIPSWIQSTRFSLVATLTAPSPQYMTYFPPTFAITQRVGSFGSCRWRIAADLLPRARPFSPSSRANAGPCFFQCLRSREVATHRRGSFLFHDV